MELPLQPNVSGASVKVDLGFNPCFNGTTSATEAVQSNDEQAFGFNPCFNGTTSATM